MAFMDFDFDARLEMHAQTASIVAAHSGAQDMLTRAGIPLHRDDGTVMLVAERLGLLQHRHADGPLEPFSGSPGEDPIPPASLAPEGALLRVVLDAMREHEADPWSDADGCYPECRPQAEALSMMVRAVEGDLWAEMEERGLVEVS